MSTAPPGLPHPVRTPNATPRSANIRDLPRIIAAADETFRSPAPPGLGSMGHDYPLLFAPENAENLVIAEDDNGELLAHAGFVLRNASLDGRQVKVANVGAVFTRADHRQNGLGSRVLGTAVERARRQLGADLGLVSGQRSLYERAGFSPYPPCPRYRITAPAEPDPAAAEVVPYSAAAFEDVMALYARESVHFVRSREDWHAMLGSGVIFYEPAQVLLLRRAGKNVAYLVVGWPGFAAEGGPGDPRGARVLELAGDRSEIAAAAATVAHALGVDAIDLVLPPGDQSLAQAARQRGWRHDEVRMPFTMTWWNPALRELPLPFYGFNYV
jgi:predicted N-acetyltransferase YhbS